MDNGKFLAGVKYSITPCSRVQRTNHYTAIHPLLHFSAVNSCSIFRGKCFFFFAFTILRHEILLSLLQKLEELEKEEELREAAGLYDSEPVSDTLCSWTWSECLMSYHLACLYKCVQVHFDRCECHSQALQLHRFVSSFNWVFAIFLSFRKS